MFANATILSLYADARRADDLRERRTKPSHLSQRRRFDWITRLVARPAAKPAPLTHATRHA